MATSRLANLVLDDFRPAESPDITGRFHKEVPPPPPMPDIDYTSADMWRVSGAKTKQQAKLKSLRLKKLHEDMVSAGHARMQLYAVLDRGRLCMGCLARRRPGGQKCCE